MLKICISAVSSPSLWIISQVSESCIFFYKSFVYFYLHFFPFFVIFLIFVFILFIFFVFLVLFVFLVFFVFLVLCFLYFILFILGFVIVCFAWLSPSCYFTVFHSFYIHFSLQSTFGEFVYLLCFRLLPRSLFLIFSL